MDIDTSQIDITQYISLSNFKRVASNRGGEWHGPCPFCGGEDRCAVWPAENKWSCRRCYGNEMPPKDALDFVMQNQGLTFGEALKALGLSADGPEMQTSKRQYTSMADYARQHGLESEDLIAAGWQECEKDGRPALTFNTKGGQRWRYLDGGKDRWKSEYGFKSTWYGLDAKVLENAMKEYAPLVICNGEISTVAARFYGVPALCVAGGGEREIPDDLLKELNNKWQGRIAIIMDCDDTGRKAAVKIAKQLPNAAVLDIDLGEGQDLADFVRLNQFGSLKEIKRMMPMPPQAPMTHREAARQTIARLNIDNTIDSKPIYLPFTSWHQYGGYTLVGWPAKITAGVGMSGHGKTSWLNTMIDELLKSGEIGVGLMPEFEQDEYHWDRLQRYSGAGGFPLVTAELMMLWELWKKENELGIPVAQRRGKALDNHQKDTIQRISAYTESWPGEFELFPFESSLENALLQMGDSIQDRRARGQLVTFAAFDYIQILKAENTEDNENSFETVLSLIKSFVIKHKIHGIVTSQVNKTADKANREGGRILGTTDMRYVRDDKINLLVTLNLVYDEYTGQRKQLSNGNYAGVANIAKNTKGRTGMVNMQVDFEHLCWLDETWSSSMYNTLDDSEPFDGKDL